MTRQRNDWKQWILGILFTFFIAGLGLLLSLLPGFQHIGQLASAIIIAIVYRHFFGYPRSIHTGIQFSSKIVLRFAIILYGLKLNIDIIFRDGLGLLLRDAMIITFAILLIIWLAKKMQADKQISLLLGVGTGVCGAAAIAAIAPIVKAKEEDTAISVNIIALMGTVFAIIYTVIRPLLPMDDLAYGTWSGMSLHELAHVAIAAEPAGDDALAIALLAKLGRVFLLVPLSFLFIFWMQRNNNKAEKTDVAFPYFLIGFIIMSILGSYVIGDIIPISSSMMTFINHVTTWLLTAAMVGLGLNVSLKDVKNRALKPLIAMTITSMAVSLLAWILL